MDLFFLFFSKNTVKILLQSVKMNRRNNRRNRNTENNKQKKIIRCKALNRPVFEHEVCSKFSSKTSTNSQKTCLNCKYGF